jgi:hypothetical protein
VVLFFIKEVIYNEKNIRFFCFFIYCFCSTGLNAQSSNIEQNLIGTWELTENHHAFNPLSREGGLWTFYADGTLSVNRNNNSVSGKWIVSENNITLFLGNRSYTNTISISSDGRTLLIYGYAVYIRK